jgi:mannose-6-phosphate isomerase
MESSNLTSIEEVEVRQVPKGWGKELIFASTPEYCGKLLCFRGGTKGSMHFHLKKLEHFYCFSGSFKLKYINPVSGQEKELDLFAGEAVKIPRGHAHQIHCLVEGVIFEASTEDRPDDSYRVQKGDSQKA